MSKTNEPKLTNKDVQKVVKQYAYQSESNIVFGFVAHKDSAISIRKWRECRHSRNFSWIDAFTR